MAASLSEPVAKRLPVTSRGPQRTSSLPRSAPSPHPPASQELTHSFRAAACSSAPLSCIASRAAAVSSDAQVGSRPPAAAAARAASQGASTSPRGMRAMVSMHEIGAAASMPPLPRSSGRGGRTQSLGAMTPPGTAVDSGVTAPAAGSSARRRPIIMGAVWQVVTTGADRCGQQVRTPPCSPCTSAEEQPNVTGAPTPPHPFVPEAAGLMPRPS
mmetsp:Transcript_18082/g.57644  ORF Transcript_18082/g.57644 Transcript_18082/m.57644 type:complete len:214 (+) Transcript_18082:639-1280(+)